MNIINNIETINYAIQASFAILLKQCTKTLTKLTQQNILSNISLQHKKTIKDLKKLAQLQSGPNNAEFLKYLKYFTTKYTKGKFTLAPSFELLLLELIQILKNYYTSLSNRNQFEIFQFLTTINILNKSLKSTNKIVTNNNSKT